MTTFGLPGGTRGKGPPCECRRHKRRKFRASVGKIPWRRACLLLFIRPVLTDLYIYISLFWKNPVRSALLWLPLSRRGKGALERLSLTWGRKNKWEPQVEPASFWLRACAKHRHICWWRKTELVIWRVMLTCAWVMVTKVIQGSLQGKGGPGHWALRQRPEKKPILTPCWNCFFDLLFVAFVITIIIQNGIMPLCLTVKLSAFVQNPVHL